MPSLFLPAPLPHQIPVLADPSRRKLWRAGRRTGKSRAALIAATVGHGPDQCLRGILAGANGVWIAPDFPQARAIWREEIKRRFSGFPMVDVNEVEKRVEIAGKGRLELRSAENIDSVRGGALDFAIIDEGAWLHLRYALHDIILPALLDRNGWLFIISTTNAGHDGNPEKDTPSYFNQLVEEIMSGARTGWKHWHNRTADNPTLSADQIAALRAEYPEGSPTAAQELDAELGVGAGRFYPELSEINRLFVSPSQMPPLLDWHEYWGGFDWGFVHPAAFGQYVRIGRTVYKLDTTFMHRYQDEEMGALIRGTADARCLRTVYAGPDCFAQRKAHSAAAETVADVFGRYSICLERANVDKLARAKVLRRMVALPRVGPLPAGAVEFRLVDTPGNRRAIHEIASLVPDPLNINVPGKRDANEKGEHGDDGADETSYALATPSFATEEPAPLFSPSNVSDGTLEAPWEVAEKRVRMPDEEGIIDKRSYVHRSGMDDMDRQFG